MQVGICCSGSGRGASADYIKISALASERAGFSTFWFGEHVVLFDDYTSKYPYSPTGSAKEGLPHPASPFCDPLIAMTWAAAATSTIEIATSVLLLPQRNPVVLAKELATLDYFSNGRVLFGAGVGWSKEEYDAIGADWPARGKRMNEYIGALRSLWTEKTSTFHGETISFDNAYCYPKPIRNSDIPIVIGGESENAIKRVARYCDGWLPVALSPSQAKQKITYLNALTKEYGRDPSRLRIIKTITAKTPLDILKRYQDAGVTEFLITAMAEMPRDEHDVASAIEKLGGQFVAPLADF